jgi:drug/metabolite transporter (DMT)-like permease
MPQSRPLLAAAWMMGAVASFTAMAVAGRELQADMNTFELMLYRSAIGFAVVVLLLARSGRGFSQVRSRNFPLHLQRNLFHYTGQNLWFFAVATIPLGQLVALEFTNPLWVALLAPFMLAEPLTRTRLLAAGLGFTGVLIVARPGATPIEPGHLAVLCAALLFALNTIYTRQIMSFDGVLCVLFWMTLLQGTASLLLSLPGGIPGPTAHNLPWLVVVGVTGLTAHYALTSALGHAPASVVAPMEFARLPFFAVVGAWLYGEPLQVAVLVGAALIIGGNLLNLRAETRRARA